MHLTQIPTAMKSPNLLFFKFLWKYRYMLVVYTLMARKAKLPFFANYEIIIILSSLFFFILKNLSKHSNFNSIFQNKPMENKTFSIQKETGTTSVFIWKCSFFVGYCTHSRHRSTNAIYVYVYVFMCVWRFMSYQDKFAMYHQGKRYFVAAWHFCRFIFVAYQQRRHQHMNCCVVDLMLLLLLLFLLQLPLLMMFPQLMFQQQIFCLLLLNFHFAKIFPFLHFSPTLVAYLHVLSVLVLLMCWAYIHQNIHIHLMMSLLL